MSQLLKLGTAPDTGFAVGGSGIFGRHRGNDRTLCGGRLPDTVEDRHRPSGPPLAAQRRPTSGDARVVDWRAATPLFGRAAASLVDGTSGQGRASRGVPGSGVCEVRSSPGCCAGTFRTRYVAMGRFHHARRRSEDATDVIRAADNLRDRTYIATTYVFSLDRFCRPVGRSPAVARLGCSVTAGVCRRRHPERPGRRGRDSGR